MHLSFACIQVLPPSHLRVKTYVLLSTYVFSLNNDNEKNIYLKYATPCSNTQISKRAIFQIVCSQEYDWHKSREV